MSTLDTLAGAAAATHVQTFHIILSVTNHPLLKEPPAQDLVWFSPTGSRLCWVCSRHGAVIDAVFVSLAAPEIDEAAVMQLAEMGFPLEACRKAVYYTGNMGPEMAFNWIIAHMEEPGKMTGFTGTRVHLRGAKMRGKDCKSLDIQKWTLVLLTVSKWMQLSNTEDGEEQWICHLWQCVNCCDKQPSTADGAAGMNSLALQSRTDETRLHNSF